MEVVPPLPQREVGPTSHKEVIMVTPLTAYEKTYVRTAPWFHRVTGYRQKPPYNLDSPVTIVKCFAVNADARSPWTDSGTDQLRPDGRTSVNNRLYGRFRSEVGDCSSFGATLTAEGRETASMLSGTVIRIARAANAARKLQFQKVASELGIPYKEKTKIIKRARVRKDGTLRNVRLYRHRYVETPDGRQFAKTAAGAWLYWSYGVKPLASDIYNGLDFLSKDPPDREIKVSAKFTLKRSDLVPPSPGYYGTLTTWDLTFRGRCGARVEVANANRYLLSEMGLTNPASWVIEAIPLSFVVDWFSNLSQVVSSWTDFEGLSITSKWRSEKTTCTQTFQQFGPYPVNWKKTTMQLRRVLDLPSPKLVFAYEPPNWQRGLNAISLLIGAIPKR